MSPTRIPISAAQAAMLRRAQDDVAAAQERAGAMLAILLADQGQASGGARIVLVDGQDYLEIATEPTRQSTSVTPNA